MRNIILFLALFVAVAVQAKTIYVKPSSAPSTVWEGQTDVYNTIIEAMGAALSEDEIWIAGGEYEIGQGGINYNEAKNLKFYGGFSGVETSTDDRVKVQDGEEWEFQSPTLLKMTAGSTCFWVNNPTIIATFDGLTIDGNNILGTRGIGGGAWRELFITRCVLKNNQLNSAFGAGILGKNKINVEHCLVENNTATKPSSGSKWGGAICILAANSSVKNSTVRNNTYNDSGAGIGIDNVAGTVIADCKILGNSTTNSGGGICGYQIADIHNCWIEGNSAGSGGGIYHRAYSGSGIIYNCFIVANKTTGSGGGIAFGNSTNPVIVYNCLIVNNESNGTGVSFTNNTSNHQIINCLLYNNINGDKVMNVNSAGTKNIFKNNILDTDNIANLTQTACIIETDATKLFNDISSGDFTPPAIDFAGEDKGDASDLVFDGNMDYAGVSRIQGDNIEIGPYEVTPSTLVSLKALKINGIQIEGFLDGQTTYDVVLQAPIVDYPTVTVEPTVKNAVVSPFTYNPTTFDSEITNVVGFTVTNGPNSTSYTINFTVDKMPELSHLILTRIKADKLTRKIDALEADLDTIIPKMLSDGSFSDCHYASKNRGDGDVLNHLIRLREMGIAYTQPGNKYYEDDTIYDRIVKGLEFWYSKRWIDNNWWYNRIGHPHRLGETFIALYGGKKDIREEKIFQDLVVRWKSEMGDPDSPKDATTAGANKCDIAMHWIYRSCLTNNEEDLAKAADRSFLIVENTTGEGIQHDWSFRQHGAQLYIGGYGTELIQLVTRQASYLSGTKYALSGEKLDILSQFVRNTYLPVIRGQRMSFSTLGRGVSRTNNTKQSGFSSLLTMLKEVDNAHAGEYDNAIKRLRGEEAADFQLSAFQKHYYRGEYTLQQRPEYTFDVRMVSNRMARSEYDINENRQGFFLSEGATGIFVDGEEYGSILPFWDWKKIPGTTIPDLAVMRRADSYIFSGRSSYAGGVTDGLYGVTAFNMINDQALFAWNDDDGYSGTPNNSGTRLPALDFGAKKSWFIFDKEIVCLGAGIYSGHDEPVFTTVNQCRQAGEAMINSSAGEQTVGKGENVSYANVDWVLNDKVAYFFPDQPTLQVSNVTKTGSWKDINNSGSSTQIDGDVFTLWYNHGVRPTNAGYAYIIVPNTQNIAEVKNYTASNIEILTNTDSVQVVYHKELNLYGLTFFRACAFASNKLVVDASAGCVMLVSSADKDEVSVFVSDPQKQSSPIKIGIQTPHLKEMKEVVYQNPATPHQGKSLEFVVNNETPKYAGKDVLLDRSDWTIIASAQGPTDAAVAADGDVPAYMIDGDNKSAFLFVKPGKSYGGVTIPAGTKPWFMIDLKKNSDMTYLLYRHRDFENVHAWLRASKGSFYGKNTEEEEFQPIIENFDISTDVTEVRVDLPKETSYRYVKFVMEVWDTGSGSTIQVSEFNLGNTLQPDDIITGLPNLKLGGDVQFSLYPNPVKAAEPFYIHLNKEFSNASVNVYTLAGVKILEKAVNGNIAELELENQGVYIIEVKKDNSTSVLKAVVK